MNLKPDQLSALSLGYSNTPQKLDAVTLAWGSDTHSLSTETKLTQKSYTPEQIAKMLRVDEDGNLWWKQPKQGRRMSKPVGSLNNRGRLSVGIDGKIYFNHVLCFCLYHGKWPKVELDIDHINGVRDDNRKENLREVTRSENHLNSTKPRGKSEHRNTFFDNYTGLWRVSQNIKGKYKSKYFKTLDAALAFRDSIRDEFGRLHFDKT